MHKPNGVYCHAQCHFYKKKVTQEIFEMPILTVITCSVCIFFHHIYFHLPVSFVSIKGCPQKIDNFRGHVTWWCHSMEFPCHCRQHYFVIKLFNLSVSPVADMTHLDSPDGLDQDNSDSGVSTPDPATKPKKVIYEVIVWAEADPVGKGGGKQCPPLPTFSIIWGFLVCGPIPIEMGFSVIWII